MTDIISSNEDVVITVKQPVGSTTAPPPKIGLVEIHMPGSGGNVPAPLKITTSDTPPTTAANGDMFWESDTGRLFVYFDDGTSRQWVQVAPGGGGSSGVFSLDTASGVTIDTGEEYRLVMMSDGSVFAIPYDAVPPETPIGLAATVRLTSVLLTWTAATGATSYLVKRDGVDYGTTTDLSYRDIAVVIGTTYSYTVSSIDQYKQRSHQSSPVTAFIDPALNSAPTDVVITCWPNPAPTDGPAYIRVNARDIDVQNIAFTLGVDVGALTATADPSVWEFRI